MWCAGADINSIVDFFHCTEMDYFNFQRHFTVSFYSERTYLADLVLKNKGS
jgi:hypothetical protein